MLAQSALPLASDDTAAGDRFQANRALLAATHGTGATQPGRKVGAFGDPAALVTLCELMRSNEE